MTKKIVKKLMFIILLVVCIMLLNGKESYGMTTTTGGLAVCNKAVELLQLMHREGWIYESGSSRNTFEAAHRLKKLSCSGYVTLVYQAAGFLKEGTWLNHLPSASEVRSKYEKNTINCTWHKVNKKLSDIPTEDLQPGDCIIFSHTIGIFAERKNGRDYLYMCMTPSTTERCVEKEGPIAFDLSYSVYYIVRPNGNPVVNTGVSTAGKTVYIAAGHQSGGNITKTSKIAPTSNRESSTGATSGAVSHVSGVAEYELALQISKATQSELEGRGYTVKMLRTTNECTLNNAERAVDANESGADIAIIIHCDDAEGAGDGPFAVVPNSQSKGFLDETDNRLYDEIMKLSDCVVSETRLAVGKGNRSNSAQCLPQINWTEIPLAYLECGNFMVESDDKDLNDPDYHKKLATGIANGIDEYFGITTYSNSNSGANGASAEDKEADTFNGAMGSVTRNVWNSISTFFENHILNNEESTVMYNLNPESNSTGTISVGGNQDIIASCEAVMDLWLDRNMHYSLDGLSGDVEYALNTQNIACCGTYVGAVLYHSGLLTKEQIGTGFNAVQSYPTVLGNAGWTKVTGNITNWSQAKPGDVLVQYDTVGNASRHVMIYAGNGKVYDERTCVTSGDGDAPTGEPRTHQQSLSKNCQVWRAP